MKSLLVVACLLISVSSVLALEDGPVQEWKKDHGGKDYVAVTGQVVDGKKFGEWREYSPNGDCTRKTVYDSDGRIVTDEENVYPGQLSKEAAEYRRTGKMPSNSIYAPEQPRDRSFPPPPQLNR